MARISAESGPHPVDRHVGRRVHDKRVAMGYNQTELGRALGLTFQQVQKYEKGANRISSSKLWDIARFLDVDIGYFFEGLADDHSDRSQTVLEVPSTRQSVEIARLASRLSARQQKLALELIKTIASRAGPELN